MKVYNLLIITSFFIYNIIILLLGSIDFIEKILKLKKKYPARIHFVLGNIFSYIYIRYYIFFLLIYSFNR